MTQTWSEFLYKSSISDFLIEEVTEQLGKKKQPVPKDITIQAHSKTDVSKLKKAIQSIEEQLSHDLANTLMHELDEITEDQKEASTRRGKYIMDINDWAQPFYPEFRSISEFEDAYIGGHTREMVVFISGKVDSQESYDKLVKYVESKKPPYKVLAKVTIGGEATAPLVSDVSI